MTERRLRDVQALGGPPEVQLYGDGHESGEMFQLHGGGDTSPYGMLRP